MALKTLFRISKPHRVRLFIIFYTMVVNLQVNHAALDDDYSELPAVTFDVTKPLNAVFSGETSKQAFIEAVNSNVAFGEDIQTRSLSLLYSSDCNISEPETCSNQISSVTLLLNETFEGIMKNIDLTICLTVDVPTVMQIGKEDNNTSIQLPDQPLKILMNLHENTTCQDLKIINYWTWEKLISKTSVKWISLRPNTKVGFGYTEALIHCNEIDRRRPMNKADFLVLNMGFGNTTGVTESFGLFKDRMDALHKDNLQFITSILNHHLTPKPVYFPSASSVGQESHRRLLVKYAENWVSSDGEKRMIIQAPNFEPEVATNFFILPYVQSSTCTGYHPDIGNLMWYVPSALATVSKYFNSVLLTHSQWEKLHSEEVQILYGKIKMPNDETIRLDVFLDYTDKSCLYEVKKVEEQLKKRFIQPLINIMPTTLIFQISNEGKNRMRAHVPLEFAQRVSDKYKLGCAYYMESFRFQNVSTVLKVVEACKKINGSLYILWIEVGLKPWNFHQNYHLHYEDDVRQELEYVDGFRKQIFERHPDSTVYVGVIISRAGTGIFGRKDKDETTAFCNPAFLDGNLYIEAITNWARFNNFPLIFKSAFDYLERKSFLGWLSFLRPVEASHYASPSSENEDKNEAEKVTRVAALNPSFVLRNYPEGINNWTVDPCIEWSRDPPKIVEDFFHNPFIGATFDTIDLVISEDQLEAAYEVMLQFVSYRFRSVEISVGNNGIDIINAMNLLKSKGTFNSNHSIYICYATQNYEDQAWESAIKKALDQLETSRLSAIKGIHIDLRKGNSINRSFETISKQLDRAKPLQINMGILINSSTCMKIARLITTMKPPKESKILVLLPKLNYIVCKSELDVVLQESPQIHGSLFDTQWYLKRIFNQFQPHLSLFFRVKLIVTLNKDTATINKYIRAISHFHKFGAAYDIKNFLVEAFDGESTARKSGWWEIQNFTDLDNPKTYVEKESVQSGQLMWYPPAPVKTIEVEHSNNMAIIVSVFTVLSFVLVAISVFSFMRYKKLSKYLSDEEVEEFLNGKPRPKKYGLNEEVESASAAEYMKFKCVYDLPRSDLVIDLEEILGAGNFGTVYKGVAKGKDAAIKKPNKDCPKGTFKSVLTEIKVLCYIGEHQNVVGFFGAYTKEINKGILFVATELCSNGSLEGYLRKKKQVVARDEAQSTQLVDFIYYHELHRFSMDIANGMDYIESKHVVHGDLSARNVLLDENYICKIGDFGLSRKLYEYQKYGKKSQEPLPWKWMAYESLTKMEFTSKSDVWSYGVTLFEVYSLGGTPYGGLNWTMEFADELKNGLRLTRPEFASEEIYSKMLECWNLNVDQRPTFAQLTEFFKQFCHAEYMVLTEKG